MPQRLRTTPDGRPPSQRDAQASQTFYTSVESVSWSVKRRRALVPVASLLQLFRLHAPARVPCCFQLVGNTSVASLPSGLGKLQRQRVRAVSYKKREPHFKQHGKWVAHREVLLAPSLAPAHKQPQPRPPSLETCIRTHMIHSTHLSHTFSTHTFSEWWVRRAPVGCVGLDVAATHHARAVCACSLRLLF